MKELRSTFPYGQASECRRGLMRGMGYSNEELNRPLIGIINSWNEYNPGHVHLNKIAERVKQGVREAGGLPVEVMTTGICDGMCLKDPRYIEVPSRNSIADQVELCVEGNFFDGIVMLCSCDSIVPGHLMGAARCNIPTIFVTGGYMALGQAGGKELLHIHAQDQVMAVKEGKLTEEAYEELIANSWTTCGACGSMTTANSMCAMAEALGMSLPGNSTVSAVSPRIYEMAYQAGKRILALVEQDIKARDIMTVDAFMNAIKVDMAIAGSANLILHIPAIANEAGLDLPWWKYFDEISNEVPLLSHLAPGGEYNLKDLDMAGGMPALMNALLPKLNGDCMTVNGKTVRENVQNAKIYMPDVIRTLDNPVSTEPGIGVLYGNIAPEGAILKIAAVPERLMTYRGPAHVFNSLQEGLDALHAGQVKSGEACVLRFLGLKARFGTTAFPFQEDLKGMSDLFDTCAIITDGRYSGGTSGLSVGYVSPEAALGSPLAIIEDGDMIEIDVKNRTIHLDLPEEVIEERLKHFKFEFPEGEYPPFLRLFSKNVGSMAKGGVWEL